MHAKLLPCANPAAIQNAASRTVVDVPAQGTLLSITRRRIAVFIAASLLCGGGFAIWKTLLEERFFPRAFGAVVPGLVYRSGFLHEDLVADTLAEHRIRRIVDLTSQGHLPEQEAEKHAARKLGIERLCFALRGDGTGDVDRYADAVTHIARAWQAGEPILVHCAAGAQRTGGVIAAFRLLVKGDPVDEVYAEMQAYGWRPERDGKLVAFLNQHLGELAAILKHRGVIEQIPDPLPQLPSE